MRKDQQQSFEKNWLFFATLACLCAGFANYFIGTLSSKYHWKSMFPAWIGQLAMFTLYHIYVLVCKPTEKDGKPTYVSYSSTPSALLAILIRGGGHLGMMIGCTLAFVYADQAHVNQGIIGGLFVSQVLFTILFFRLKYKEKVGMMTLCGIVTLIAGVFCVSLKTTEKHTV